MMVVSHSLYSQYPIVRKYGKDSVVVISISQGHEINRKYTLLKNRNSILKDSLVSLNDTLSEFAYQNVVLSAQRDSATHRYILYKRMYDDKHRAYRSMYKDFKKENRRSVLRYVVLSLLVLFSAFTVQ